MFDSNSLAPLFSLFGSFYFIFLFEMLKIFFTNREIYVHNNKDYSISILGTA
jgi:hypothetical protein